MRIARTESHFSSWISFGIGSSCFRASLIRESVEESVWDEEDGAAFTELGTMETIAADAAVIAWRKDFRLTTSPCSLWEVLSTIALELYSTELCLCLPLLVDSIILEKGRLCTFEKACTWN